MELVPGLDRGGGRRVGEAESRVADEDRYAYDQHGIRRFIRAGDAIPEGWKAEQPSSPEPEPQPEPKPKGKPKRS